MLLVVCAGLAIIKDETCLGCLVCCAVVLYRRDGDPSRAFLGGVFVDNSTPDCCVMFTLLVCRLLAELDAKNWLNLMQNTG